MGFLEAVGLGKIVLVTGGARSGKSRTGWTRQEDTISALSESTAHRCRLFCAKPQVLK